MFHSRRQSTARTPSGVVAAAVDLFGARRYMTERSAPMTSSLFEPLVFRGGARAKNRVWLAPMTNQQSADDGTLSDDELRWLEMRARGGFGVVETCAAHVSRDGQGWKGELGIYDDHLLPGLDRLAGAIAIDGALGIVQLFHGGVRAPSSLTGEQPWSASAFPVDAPGLEAPRAATEVDIKDVIARFREAAVRAHRAGFAGVELHGAHGYLLSQFLSRTMNTRSDEWGGAIEGRARLVRETMRAVRSAVPSRFVVGVRLSPEDFGNAKGLDLDESIAVARWLCEDGADFIHLSLWDSTRNTRKRPEEHAVPSFRAALPSEVPIVVAGNIWTRADAEKLLERGASAVALGRAAIANPAWPKDVAGPTWEPRRPPLTIAELRERGLNATFAGYMRQWKGFVSD
jgi:2,4-dienoyl-CoA reductase-like NADH-dependent reductase (Old Yellow Enzyme family)